MRRFIHGLAIMILAVTSGAIAADGNRLAYLDGPIDPYYPHREFPKLITPQWVGEDGVECVVTLAIDDMRDSAKYEAFLRPILNRLKQIDGRAPVSIMTCRANPADPQLQAWLKEGVSIEVHTYDHPCPCLQDGGLVKAKETYDKCVDLLNEIPGNQPVAFRMPCCDSKNTPTPRFWAEVFNKTTAKGNLLQIDSSVFNIITSKDKELPKEITQLPDGSERFRRYIPFPNFVNTIEDYPYPYVIGGMCWEFPCVVPSDWSAQHVQKPNNPDTVRDWKLALDACVIKQGVFNLVFHPHGWIKAEQIIELIDHAVSKHGKKVKFLTFKECAGKLHRAFGDLRAMKHPKQLDRVPDGLPTGITFDPTKETGLRLVDVNRDGQLDCLFSNPERYSLYLFKDKKEGWSIKVFDVVRGKEDGKLPPIPPFVRGDGTNNGAWFHSGALWLMNEDTWRLPDHVFKLTFAEMLAPLASGGSEATGNAAPPSLDTKPGATGRRTPPARQESQLSGPRFDELEMTPPKSPEESLKAMHVRPGMKVELVAAEPLVVDPVAFDWGPDGRLWVVEMRDYPNGMTWNKEGDQFGVPGGRVKVLTDTDGDGRYDKASVFLDEVPFPTGVKVWRKGILVTAAPEILYAEDKDGDDRADERKTLYRGFGEGNQQHRVNGLRWGLDNWLHVGNGDSGGIIKSLTNGLIPTRSVSEGREVNVNGRDLRIRPDTGELDTTSGNTQFGRERDDWGNWFGGNNSNPMWHYALDDQYLRRNPHVAPPPVRKSVSILPGTAPVFPKSQTLARFNDFSMANRFTSACSPIIYRDELLGPEYYGNSFVCEPVHNLVHREIVERQGTTFTSKRAPDEQQSEFLASEDHWFRPSMCRTGPDGALWVADMYRFVVEHPKWIPEAAQKKLDMRAGDDKGRIYRIYPADKQPRPIPLLDQLDTVRLVAALNSPNGPQRDLVHQMILWRDDKAAIEPLKKLAAEAKRPQVRLQALCVLDGLSGLTDDLLLRALTDEHPAVRRHGVWLAEPRLAASAELAAAAFKPAADTDLQVRMQVAYSLGAWNDPQAAEVLARFLTAPQQDRYLAAAAMSSVNKVNLSALMSRVLATENRDGLSGLLEQLFACAVAMESNEAMRHAMDAVLLGEPQGLERWKVGILVRFLQELQRRKADVTALVGGNALDSLKKLFSTARVVAQGNDPGRGKDLSLRTAAIRLLGREPDERAQDIDLLQSLLTPQQPDAVQAAAVSALAALRLPDTASKLLAGWSSYTPSLRAQVLEVLASREDGSLAVLDAIESGQIAASQLDARRRQQFLTSRSRSVRERAEKVLAGAANPDRQKLVETYVVAASSSGGDLARGKAVFIKRCANCHKLDGGGYAIGPDLAPLANRTPEYLLTAILDPNRAVEDRYLEYVVLTADGRQLTGMLLEETGASLTLVAPEGKQTVVPRSELEQMKSSGKSLMPEGIERDVPPPEMADLVAYLQKIRPEPKKLPGNHPEVVRPVIVGSIRLLATNARVYGPTIKMEETYRALGWWNSMEDHAVWSFEVPAGSEGEYRVTIDYSCADNSAGNTVVIEVAGQTLAGKVEGTGAWDAFRGWNIGTVTLPAGEGELLVRSDGPIKRALFDLRGVRLNPVGR